MDSYDKDPDAVLDYQWDFSAWLPTGDTISTDTITVASGDVVVNSHSHSSTTVTAWIAGGTVNSAATVTARIVTAQGRTDDRTIRLNIKQR